MNLKLQIFDQQIAGNTKIALREIRPRCCFDSAMKEYVNNVPEPRCLSVESLNATIKLCGNTVELHVESGKDDF